MEETIRQIAATVNRMEGRLDSCCERLETHHDEIYGNGQPGLKSRMYHNEKVAASAAKSRKAVWSMVGSVAGAVVSVLSGLFGGK